MTAESTRRRATGVGRTAAVAAGAVAVLSTALSGGQLVVPVAAAGLLGVWLGARRGRGAVVDAGGFAFGVALLGAGALGGQTVPLVVAAAAAVVAWDAASDAVARGRHVGGAAAGSVEGVRVAATSAVALTGGVAALAVSRSVTPGLPTSVLAVLAAAVALLVAAVARAARGH